MNETLSIPRIVIAGAASGVGKTSVMVGLLGALQQRGLKIAAFKCGPDYLDPTYHARLTGRASYNLDGWMMGRAGVLSTFTRAAAGADLALIEGVMGLFDGASATDDAGSTAEIARWLAAPVVLLLDASGLARTAEAVAYGFKHFAADVPVAGMICNRLGSRGHLDLIRQAVRSLTVLGGLPQENGLAFPARHLGLRTADRETIPETLLQGWARLTENWVDLEALLALARSAGPLPAAPLPAAPTAAARCRIGIARDAAFHFYYPENLRLLEQFGATLVEFSPLANACLPAVDALYLGGGYPEEFAGELQANASMRQAIRDFGASGRPIYAECGGLMYLTEAIVRRDGTSFAMTGLIPSRCRMFDKLQALGYVEVQTRAPSIWGQAQICFRGHQFRYSAMEPAQPTGVAYHYTVRRRRDGHILAEGYARHNVLGSYIHAHFASNPEMARGLVDTAVHGREAKRPK